MTRQAFILTKQSSNSKLGDAAVTTSQRDSCPDTCPLKRNGCYADNSHLGSMWNKLSQIGPGESFSHGRGAIKTHSFDDLLAFIAKNRRRAFRHLQAGDLAHKAGVIIAEQLRAIGKACKKARNRDSWMYTHHDLDIKENAKIVKEVNALGFMTINASCETLEQVDKRLAQGFNVVTIMPENCDKITKTPAGNTVVQCPATYSDIKCSECLICAKDRQAAIGFPVHGAAKRKAEAAIRKAT